ncbi:unnamed protein product [Ixodes hexagonus]
MEPVGTGPGLGRLWFAWAAFVNSLLFVVVAGLLYKAFTMYTKGVCRSKQQMDGKTVIITGGNAGIGKETAKELARRKARVILACRNLEKADKAAQEILRETHQRVVVKHLDLASFKSVLEFAQDIIQTEARLDVLINNAGMIHGGSDVLTEDGFEVCFQSNYLSHFLLTFLLLDLLKKSAPSRIINLSSVLHHFGSIEHFEDKARGTYPWKYPLFVYSNTKLAVTAFTRVLAKKLVEHGQQPVTVHGSAPGLILTVTFQSEKKEGITGYIAGSCLWRPTPREGAQTTLHLALEPSLEKVTGHYFEDCRKARVSYRLLNRDLSERVFALTAKLVNIDGSEMGKLLST